MYGYRVQFKSGPEWFTHDKHLTTYWVKDYKYRIHPDDLKKYKSIPKEERKRDKILSDFIQEISRCEKQPLKQTLKNVKKDGTWYSNKKDVTDTAVGAVAQHLLQLNEKVQFTYKGEKYELKVVKI